MYNNYNPQANNMYAPQQRPQPSMTQVLTKEQVSELRNRGGGLSLAIDDKELLKSYCTHKENGNIVVTKQGDGMLYCSICGEKFNEINMDEEAVQEAVNIVVDILQNVKTFWLDIPQESAKQYYPIIPLISKLPKIYKVALDNFSKYETGNAMMQQNQSLGFNLLNNLVSPQYTQNPYAQQGGYQPQYAPQPQYQPQQQQYPQYQQQGSNGFGYYGDPQQQYMTQNAPQPQYQQNAPQPQYQQNAPQAQQPAPQTQAGPVVNNKVFNI